MNMIERGQHVKCFMRNGMSLEGIVEEWLPGQAVLKSLDGKSLMFIHRPGDDILLTKVVLEEPEIIPEETKVVEETERKEHVRQKLTEVLQPDVEPELQKKNIQELRQMVQDQDRQIIANKTKEHFGSPGAGKTTHYSSPYTQHRTPGRKVRSAYQPGKLPPWVK